MSIEPIKKIISSMEESSQKKLLNKRLNILEKDITRTQTKYLKANEDKLTLSHLLAKVNRDFKERPHCFCN
jgi:uncharacterized protein (DUF927 family)